ncbi:MAG: hypothetical protein ACRC6T_08260 [Sarcina sp.]
MNKQKINSKILIGIIIVIGIFTLIIIKHFTNKVSESESQPALSLGQAQKTLNDYQAIQSTFLDSHPGTKYVGTRTLIYLEIMNTISPNNTSTHSEVSKAVIESVNKLSDEELMDNAPQGIQPLLLAPIVQSTSDGSMIIPVKIDGKIKNIYVKLVAPK